MCMSVVRATWLVLSSCSQQLEVYFKAALKTTASHLTNAFCVLFFVLQTIIVSLNTQLQLHCEVQFF